MKAAETTILAAGEGRSFPARPFEVRVKVESAQTRDACRIPEAHFHAVERANV